MDNERKLVKLKIPPGLYCYEIVKTHYKTTDDGILYVASFDTRYCPFWYRTQSHGACLMYGTDSGLSDACKSCGFRES